MKSNIFALKALRFTMLSLFVTTMLIGINACRDEFDEQAALEAEFEFLAAQAAADQAARLAELQAQLQSEQAIVAAQEAGELAQLEAQLAFEARRDSLFMVGGSVNYTVAVVIGNNTTFSSGSRVEATEALNGLDVTLVQDGQVVTETTGASGIVAFQDLRIGKVTVNITPGAEAAANFTPVTFVADITPSSPFERPVLSGGADGIVTGDPNSYKRNAGTIVPVFQLPAGDDTDDPSKFAFISGRATIETDLTNFSREIAPAGTLVSASINQFTSGQNGPNGATSVDPAFMAIINRANEATFGGSGVNTPGAGAPVTGGGAANGGDAGAAGQIDNNFDDDAEGDGKLIQLSYSNATFTAVTDADGDYTLTVPAFPTGDGLPLAIRYSDVVADQTIIDVVNRQDNEASGEAVYGVVTKRAIFPAVSLGDDGALTTNVPDGYTNSVPDVNAVSVTIESPIAKATGSGAEVYAYVDSEGGSIDTVVVERTDDFWYTQVPNVVIPAPNKNPGDDQSSVGNVLADQATGVAVLSNGTSGYLTGVTITSSGAGYTTASSEGGNTEDKFIPVTISPSATLPTSFFSYTIAGGGSVVADTLENGQGEIIIVNSPDKYTQIPTVTFAAPNAGGTRATGTAKMQYPTGNGPDPIGARNYGKIESVTINNPGSGYTPGDEVAISFSTWTDYPQLRLVVDEDNAAIETIRVIDNTSNNEVAGGKNLTMDPIITITGTGTGADTIRAGFSLTNGQVTNVTVPANSGYDPTPNATKLSVKSNTEIGTNKKARTDHFFNPVGNATNIVLVNTGGNDAAGSGGASNTTFNIVNGSGQTSDIIEKAGVYRRNANGELRATVFVVKGDSVARNADATKIGTVSGDDDNQIDPDPIVASADSVGSAVFGGNSLATDFPRSKTGNNLNLTAAIIDANTNILAGDREVLKDNLVEANAGQLGGNGGTPNGVLLADGGEGYVEGGRTAPFSVSVASSNLGNNISGDTDAKFAYTLSEGFITGVTLDANFQTDPNYATAATRFDFGDYRIIELADADDGTDNDGDLAGTANDRTSALRWKGGVVRFQAASTTGTGISEIVPTAGIYQDVANLFSVAPTAEIVRFGGSTGDKDAELRVELGAIDKVRSLLFQSETALNDVTFDLFPLYADLDDAQAAADWTDNPNTKGTNVTAEEQIWENGVTGAGTAADPFTGSNNLILILEDIQDDLQGSAYTEYDNVALPTRPIRVQMMVEMSFNTGGGDDALIDAPGEITGRFLSGRADAFRLVDVGEGYSEANFENVTLAPVGFTVITTAPPAGQTGAATTIPGLAFAEGTNNSPGIFASSTTFDPAAGPNSANGFFEPLITFYDNDGTTVGAGVTDARIVQDWDDNPADAGVPAANKLAQGGAADLRQVEAINQVILGGFIEKIVADDPGDGYDDNDYIVLNGNNTPGGHASDDAAFINLNGQRQFTYTYTASSGEPTLAGITGSIVSGGDGYEWKDVYVGKDDSGNVGTVANANTTTGIDNATTVTYHAFNNLTDLDGDGSFTDSDDGDSFLEPSRYLRLVKADFFDGGIDEDDFIPESAMIPARYVTINVQRRIQTIYIADDGANTILTDGAKAAGTGYSNQILALAIEAPTGNNLRQARGYVGTATDGLTLQSITLNSGANFGSWPIVTRASATNGIANTADPAVVYAPGAATFGLSLGIRMTAGDVVTPAELGTLVAGATDGDDIFSVRLPESINYKLNNVTVSTAGSGYTHLLNNVAGTFAPNFIISNEFQDFTDATPNDGFNITIADDANAEVIAPAAGTVDMGGDDGVNAVTVSRNGEFQDGLPKIYITDFTERPEFEITKFSAARGIQFTTDANNVRRPVILIDNPGAGYTGAPQLVVTPRANTDWEDASQTFANDTLPFSNNGLFDTGERLESVDGITPVNAVIEIDPSYDGSAPLTANDFILVNPGAGYSVDPDVVVSTFMNEVRGAIPDETGDDVSSMMDPADEEDVNVSHVRIENIAGVPTIKEVPFTVVTSQLDNPVFEIEEFDGTGTSTNVDDDGAVAGIQLDANYTHLGFPSSALGYALDKRGPIASIVLDGNRRGEGGTQQNTNGDVATRGIFANPPRVYALLKSPSNEAGVTHEKIWLDYANPVLDEAGRIRDILIDTTATRPTYETDDIDEIFVSDGPLNPLFSGTDYTQAGGPTTDSNPTQADGRRITETVSVDAFFGASSISSFVVERSGANYFENSPQVVIIPREADIPGADYAAQTPTNYENLFATNLVTGNANVASVADGNGGITTVPLSYVAYFLAEPGNAFPGGIPAQAVSTLNTERGVASVAFATDANGNQLTGTGYENDPIVVVLNFAERLQILSGLRWLNEFADAVDENGVGSQADGLGWTDSNNNGLVNAGEVSGLSNADFTAADNGTGGGTSSDNILHPDEQLAAGIVLNAYNFLDFVTASASAQVGGQSGIINNDFQGSISDLLLINSGFGYWTSAEYTAAFGTGLAEDNIPAVFISGFGNGATATSATSAGQVVDLTVGDSGTGYVGGNFPRTSQAFSAVTIGAQQASTTAGGTTINNSPMFIRALPGVNTINDLYYGTGWRSTEEQ